MLYRKPLFWIILVVLVVISCVFIYKYGNRSLSFDLEISMDYSAAGSAARDVSKSLKLPFDDYKSSAAFFVDDDFQNYVELKCGGRKAFKEVTQSGVISPFRWYVRLFKPGETKELDVYFTPAGVFDSFTIKVPEAEAGVALERDSARTIAEQTAIQKWNQNFDDYKLVEQESETRPNGRADHNFVYERKDVKMGEALYRMRLVVSGDQLTSLNHFTKVPESFLKEYREMRSFNETLSGIANAAVVLIYVIAMLIWFVILLRGKKLAYIASLRWGLLIMLFTLLAALNEFATQWINYDTSTSPGGFVTSQVLGAFMEASVIGLLVWITILIGEALTREAYPNEVQFWRLTDKDTASSFNVFSKVLLGYLLVPVMIAYEVGFQMFTTSRLGWWSPPEILNDPNILSSQMPFISAIGGAIAPGFMEEALFRAVPLATCALLGRKYNKRWLFMILGILVQMVIFGAAHANYPNLPFYSRLVELTIVSLILAFVYIYFGLASGMILHFSYDAVLMGLPFLMSSAPGMAVNKVLFFFFLFIPLWYVLAMKLRMSLQGKKAGTIWSFLFRGWAPVPQEKMNLNYALAANSPSDTVSDEDSSSEETTEFAEEPEEIEQKPDDEKTKKGSVYPLAILFGLMITFFTPFEYIDRSISKVAEPYSSVIHNTPSLDIPASNAKEIGTEKLKAILSEQGKTLPSQYKTFADAHRSTRDELYLVFKKPSQFVAYAKLRDKYLFTEGWKISFKRFQGSLEERSERYVIQLTSKGDFVSYSHELPESMAGANLSEDEARKIVQDALLKQYSLRMQQFDEVAVKPNKLPKRTDWLFTYEDKADYGLKNGKARMDFWVRGDKLAKTKSYIFIPEATQRLFDQQKQPIDIIFYLRSILIAAFFIFAAIHGIFALGREKTKKDETTKDNIKGLISVTGKKMGSSKNLILNIFLVLAALDIIRIVATWDVLENYWFDPIQPYTNQFVTFVLFQLIQVLFLNGFIALMAGMTFRTGYERQNPKLMFSHVLWVLPFFTIRVLHVPVIDYLRVPQWNSGLSVNGFFEVLQVTVSNFLLYYGLAVLLFSQFSKWTANHSKRRWLPPLLSLVAGFCFVSGFSAHYWQQVQQIVLLFSTFAAAVLVWIGYDLYRNSKASQLPVAALVVYVFSLWSNVKKPVYPGQRLELLISCLLLILFVWLLFYRKHNKTHTKETPFKA